MIISNLVTIIVIEVSQVWQKKIRSAQNVTDVSFFCSVYTCQGGYLGLHSVGYKGGHLHIRIAKLAFHAKESPIRTWDEVFNLVSS